MSDLMDFGSYAQFLFALLFVLGLIGLFSVALKRLSMTGLTGLRSGKGMRRLSVVETVIVDGKRRMVLVRRDDKEHLLLLGQSNDLVIESGIEAVTLSDSGDIDEASTPAPSQETPPASFATDVRRFLGSEKRARQ
ncbi:MAG: flagellar biosynthetic protein FliO [Alphaproteobacteria bacterium]